MNDNYLSTVRDVLLYASESLAPLEFESENEDYKRAIEDARAVIMNIIHEYM